MSQRLTITIPDDLHERLQPVKKSLNVSQACQTAIELAIAIEEIKRKDMPVKAKTIERLKLEKEQAEVKIREQGVKDGIKDAAELSYEEFLLVEAGGDDWFEELKDWLTENRLKYLDSPKCDSYLESWREGALSFWEQIKDQI